VYILAGYKLRQVGQILDLDNALVKRRPDQLTDHVGDKHSHLKMSTVTNKLFSMFAVRKPSQELLLGRHPYPQLHRLSDNDKASLDVGF
jgi:hypothetical protein